MCSLYTITFTNHGMSLIHYIDLELSPYLVNWSTCCYWKALRNGLRSYEFICCYYR